MGETLESLSKFVREHPQMEEGHIQYAFIGGTAVRLIQEYLGTDEKRSISDFDVLNFGDKSYPVHTVDPKIIFGLVSMDTGELKDFVGSVTLGTRDYRFMDGSFLTLTKTCALDNPREKDFRDVYFLYSHGAVDNEKLRGLFTKTNILTNSSSLPLETFEWLMGYDLEAQSRLHLFQMFPKFVNLLGEFDDPLSVRGVISDCIEADPSKGGYEMSSVLYGIHGALRELDIPRDEERIKALLMLFDKSRLNDYSDFDRSLHESIIPKIRYSERKDLKSLENALSR